MILMDKVGHEVLKKGDIVRSPSGSNDWVVIDNEGDKVILEDQDAIIIKIGLRSTVFGLYTARGYTWRVIANERLEYTKLEKIIDSNVHMDSEIEQGKRIQSLIDKAQDDKINANKQRLDKLDGKDN